MFVECTNILVLFLLCSVMIYMYLFFLQIICLLILVADLLAYVLYLSPVAFESLPLRVAPYIRVIFFILSFRYCVIPYYVLIAMMGQFSNK